MSVDEKSRYDGKDYYEVFGVAKNASLKEIQRAYRILALKVHPDRNNNSRESIRDFQHLAHMMEVLGDKDRRAIYDINGLNESSFGDMDASFATFRKVTKEDIDAYAAHYIDSMEEAKDVLDAYTKFQGNFEVMLEWIPFAHPDRLGHYERLVANAIEQKVVPTYDRWQKAHSDAKSYDQKYSAEATEAQKILPKIIHKYAPFLLQEPHCEKKKDTTTEEVGEALMMGVRAREIARHQQMVASMEKRFNRGGKKKRNRDLPTEDEFQAIQQSLEKARTKRPRTK